MAYSIHARRGLGAAALLLGLALAGCQTAVAPVEVTRFHGPQEVARSGGFVIEPAPGLSTDSIEFRTYAGAVSQEMQRAGFVYRGIGRAAPADDDAGPALAAQ